jgi:hypothetical protein
MIRLTETKREERLALIQSQLLGFQLDTSDPRWSSSRLDQLCRDWLVSANGSLEDMFLALWQLYEFNPVSLTHEVGSFIKDLVVLCFTNYRTAYCAVDWRFITENLKHRTNRPQLYLALLAVPPSQLQDTMKASILLGLEQSPYYEEAVSLLSD